MLQLGHTHTHTQTTALRQEALLRLQNRRMSQGHATGAVPCTMGGEPINGHAPSGGRGGKVATLQSRHRRSSTYTKGRRTPGLRQASAWRP